MTLLRPSDPGGVAVRLHPAWLKVFAILAAVALAASLGYGIRAQHDATPHTATGRAYLGTDVGTLKIGDTAYGFGIGENGMRWYDSRGGHEGGIPPCLRRRPGYARIQLGWATAHNPDGSSERLVTWLRCVAAP